MKAVERLPDPFGIFKIHQSSLSSHVERRGHGLAVGRSRCDMDGRQKFRGSHKENLQRVPQSSVDKLLRVPVV